MDEERIGPDLANVGDRLSIDELAESILNPNAVIAEPQERHKDGGLSKMPAMPDLTSDELTKLILFLSLQTARKID